MRPEIERTFLRQLTLWTHPNLNEVESNEYPVNHFCRSVFQELGAMWTTRGKL